MSKLVEKCILIQITKYLTSQDLINHNHHGSVKNKGTQTLVQEIVDTLMEIIEKDEVAAVIQTDQSKAYDVVDHCILLNKMKILGFNQKTVRLLGSYLQDRRQYVVVDSFPSEPLVVGPNSVTQGSSLSCVLYLIMILDITGIYHSESHSPQKSLECQAKKVNSECLNTAARTFVDDNILIAKPLENSTIQQAVLKAITRLESYMHANKLALNPEKSRIMIVTKNQDIKKNFKIQIAGKEITHVPVLKILGNIVTEDITWDHHVNKVVIPDLSNRVRTLRNISAYMNPHFRKIYAGAIFRGKLTFAIDAWGGVKKELIKKSPNTSRQGCQNNSWISSQQEVKTTEIENPCMALSLRRS